MASSSKRGARGTSESKSEKYRHLAECTLRFIFLRGEKAVTHTELARSSGISRAWIYKYVGQSQEDLVHHGIDYFGKFYAGLESPFQRMTTANWREVLLMRTRDFLERTQENRWIVPLYYQFKGTNSPLGRRIDRIESLYLQNLEEELKGVSRTKDPRRIRATAEVMTALRLGLAFRISERRSRAPASIDELMEVIENWLIKQR